MVQQEQLHLLLQQYYFIIPITVFLIAANQSITAWFNRNKDYNRLHCHADSDLSGVLWIRVPENCDSGCIQFSSPHAYTEFKLIKILNQSTRDGFNYNDCFAFTPKEGTILLFPSHLMHEVRENQSREDRISVSFNLKIDILFHLPHQMRK